MAKSKKSKEKKNKAAKRDISSGDHISVSNVGDHSAVAAARHSSATVEHTEASTQKIADWITIIEKEIDAKKDLSQQDKSDLKEQVSKISDEMKKGKKVDLSRLERLINVLSVMAPDIFEVALATIASPLAGLGLAFKKIGDKAKLMETAKE